MWATENTDHINMWRCKYICKHGDYFCIFVVPHSCFGPGTLKLPTPLLFRIYLLSCSLPIQDYPYQYFVNIDYSYAGYAEVKKMWLYTSTLIRLHGVVLN
jgi:hypothetical protein